MGLYIPPSLTTLDLDLKRIDLWGPPRLPNPDFGGSGGCETNQNMDDNEDPAVWTLGKGGQVLIGRCRLGPLPPIAGSDLQSSTPSFLSGNKISINLFLIQLLWALAETGLGFQHLHLPHPSMGR